MYSSITTFCCPLRQRSPGHGAYSPWALERIVFVNTKAKCCLFNMELIMMYPIGVIKSAHIPALRQTKSDGWLPPSGRSLSASTWKAHLPPLTLPKCVWESHTHTRIRNCRASQPWSLWIRWPLRPGVRCSTPERIRPSGRSCSGTSPGWSPPSPPGCLWEHIGNCVLMVSQSSSGRVLCLYWKLSSFLRFSSTLFMTTLSSVAQICMS